MQLRWLVPSSGTRSRIQNCSSADDEYRSQAAGLSASEFPYACSNLKFENSEGETTQLLIVRFKSRSQIFRACDGVDYKWKEMGSTNVLVVKGQSQNVIAIFQRASGGLFSDSQPPSLNVTPQGIHIGDDIVVTALWFEEKRHRRESRQRANRRNNMNNMTMQNNVAMGGGMAMNGGFMGS